MTIIDRYIRRSFLGGCVPVLLLLLSLFSFLALSEELEDVGDGSYELMDALLVVAYSLPALAVNLLPVTVLLGGLLGLSVLVLADKLWILVVATPLLILGFLYNSGPRPLSYTYLGEWVTGVCYGPGVFGCLWLLSGEDLDVRAIMGAAAFAALAVCLLLSHQPPQIETDRLAGKQSFAVRYGVRRTRQVVYVLFVVFLLSFGVALWAGDNKSLLLPVYAGMSLLALIYVSRQPPKPVTVLIPSTLIMLVTLLAGLL